MIQGFSGGLLNRQLIYNLDLPSFQRDFASLKTLDHGTGPAITFTRASNATFFDANGVLQTAANDVPRFDHDPATGASRGLLIEEARTNLFERSAEFDDAYWAKTNATVTANQAAAPDGTTSVETLVETNANGGHHVSRQSVSFTSGVSYTASVFIKQFSGTRNFRIGFPSAAFPASSRSAVFNPATGVIVQQDAGVTASVQAVGTFYRVSLTATANATASDALFLNLYDGQTASYTGDGTSGLYIWGAQLEAGAFPTSYIPTTTAAATRSADLAVVNPVSGFVSANEGTLFAEFRTRTVSGTRVAASLDDDTADERIRLLTDGTDPRFVVTDGGSAQADIDAGTVAANTTYKMCAGFKVDDFAVSLNGATAGTDTSGTIPTMTHLRIGSGPSGDRMNGELRKIAYYPKRLTNALLQQLTT